MVQVISRAILNSIVFLIIANCATSLCLRAFDKICETDNIEKLIVAKKMNVYRYIIQAIALMKICMGERSIFQVILLSCFIGCMVFAAYTDINSQDIYCLCYFPMAITGIIYWFASYGFKSAPVFLSTLIFGLIFQKGVCRKLYGGGDSSIFILCMLFYGYTSLNSVNIIIYHLVHIMIALVCFIIVNIIDHNITWTLKIKKEAAFVPSIAIAVASIL